jgi:hypothetical protein
MAHTFTPAETQRGTQRAVAKRTQEHYDRMLLAKEAWDLVSTLDREEISRAMFATIMNVAVKLGESGLPTPETTLDALRLMEVAQKAHAILRLEMGESTSNVANVTVDLESLASRIAALRDASPPPTTPT